MKHVAIPTEVNQVCASGALDRRGMLALLERSAGVLRQDQEIALLLIEFDGLTAIDADWGCQAGDIARMTIAGRLRHFLTPTDHVAYLGGNGFACIVRQARGSTFAVGEAKAILNVIAQPIETACGPAVLRGAIGIACSSATTLTSGRLLAAARCAMEWIAARGASGHCVYEPDMEASPVS